MKTLSVAVRTALHCVLSVTHVVLIALRIVLTILGVNLATANVKALLHTAFLALPAFINFCTGLFI